MSQIRHHPVPPTHTAAYRGGEGVDRHRHDVHQLIYVSAGVGVVSTAHGSWVAARDRAVWIPAGVWHEHRFYGSCLFHGTSFPAEAMPFDTDAPTILVVDALARELLIAYTRDGLPEPESARILDVLRDRLERAEVRPLTLPQPTDSRLARACELVEAELSVPRDLVDLARAVNAGERTLSRLFRAELGMTYPQWRTNVRLFHAMVLIADGAPVTRTAHACGWATPSAFIDCYRRAFGHTPGSTVPARR